MSQDTAICYGDAALCVPSDTAPNNAHGFYVGGAGNVTVMTQAGTVVTFTAVPIGTTIDNLRIQKVMATNTTATLIVLLKP